MAKTIPTNPDARSYNGLLPGVDVLAEDIGASIEAQHYVLAKRGRLLLSRNFVADDATNNGLKEAAESLTERIQTKILYNAHNTSTYRPQVIVGVRAAATGANGTVRVAVGAVTGDMTYTAGAGFKYDSVTLTPAATGELTFTLSAKVATAAGGNYIIITDVWVYETDIAAGVLP